MQQPKGIWDLNQVLICSAFGETPACVFVDADPSSWGHRSAGPDLPCHIQQQTGGFLLLPQAWGGLLRAEQSGML